MKHDKGIQTADILLRSNMFRRAMRATEDNNEWYLKSILAGQYTAQPRFDPFDIIDIEWSKAPKKMKKEKIVVIATVKIARGHRVLASFMRGHWDHVHTPLFTTSADELLVECDCGETVCLLKESLRQHNWEEEAVGKTT